MKHYKIEVKLEAVRLFLTEGLTYRQIAETIGIRKADRIEKWVRQYRREGLEGLRKPIGRPKKRHEDVQDEIERLRMENALLKKLQSELRKDTLAKRDIGQSITIGKSTK